MKKEKVPQLRFPEFGEDWKRTNLENISSENSYGINSSAIEFDGKNKYIRITDIDEDTRTFRPDPLTSPSGNDFGKYKLQEDDIVFARTGASVGKTYLYNPKDGNLIYAGFLIKFSIDGAEPRFFFYLTLTYDYDKWVIVNSARSGQPGINSQEFKSLTFFIPESREQQKIADSLSSVDQKIQQLRQKKELLEAYKKGVMQKLFPSAGAQAPEIRFKDENGEDFPDWEEKRFDKFASFYAGGTPSTSNKKYYVGNISFIRSGEIENNHTEQFINQKAIENSSAKLVSKGDLLMALYGANSGEIAISKIDGAINQAVLCINTDQITEYLYNYLSFNQERIVSKYLQGGQGNLSATIVKSLRIPLPSIEEQLLIANFLSIINTKINMINLKIKKTQTFKKGLLQQMFV